MVNIYSNTWLFILGCLLWYSFPASARVGIDLSIEVTTSSAWAAYFSASELPTSFAIVQAITYEGNINPNLITTLQSAWKAGTKELSVYVYPCIATSPYAINNDISCATPEAQVDMLVDYLQARNVSFRYHFLSDSDASSSNTDSYFSLDYIPFYDYSIPNYANQRNITLQTLYINVEDAMPNYYFSYLHFDNVDFLWRYAKYAQEIYGIEIGFYTNYFAWLDIMTDLREDDGTRVYFYSDNSTHFAITNPFALHKLWVPRYDQTNSMSFFRSFADWPVVFMKQTTGGSTEARRLGSTRVCTNYIDDSVVSFNRTSLLNR